jgi:dihydrofolate reductase
MTMEERTAAGPSRKLITWIVLSLDGFAAGPGGDMAWLGAHAAHEQVMTYHEGIWRGVSTALMGRTNYEGFYGYWPPVAHDPRSAPRDRALATWLDTVEKVVFSRTLDHAEWQNARVASDLEGEVRALKRAPGQDILVLNSASIIRALLDLGLVDELRLLMVPAVVGDGLRFFPQGLSPSTWTLLGCTTFPTGAVGLHYGRPQA